jgi:hypothetical protein
MAELDREVRSPVSTGYRPSKGFGPGSSPPQPLSPGARSNPTARSRGDQAGAPQPPGPPASVQGDAHRRAKGDSGATVRVTGPEE